MYNRDEFWEARYNKGGNSGDGSYGQLAEFKAGVINSFIINNNISSLLDLGCGDGNQLQYINLPSEYLGVDVSQHSVSECSKKFPHLSFCLHSKWEPKQMDLVISQDVLYHQVEFDHFRDHLRDVFNSAKKIAIIYASNEDKLQATHVLFRKFTTYVGLMFPQFKLVSKLENPHKPRSPSDFFIFERVSEGSTSMVDTVSTWQDLVQVQARFAAGFGVVEGNIYCSSSFGAHTWLVHKQLNLAAAATRAPGPKFLEVGFNAGYSSMLLALARPDASLLAVDLGEHLYTTPCFEKLKSQYKISLMLGSSHDLLKTLEGPFDFIHVDGDHSASGCREDLKDCLRLCRPGSILVVDDTNISHIKHACQEHVQSGRLRQLAQVARPVESPYDSLTFEVLPV